MVDTKKSYRIQRATQEEIGTDDLENDFHPSTTNTKYFMKKS